MNANTQASVEASVEIDIRPWKFVTHNHPDPDAWACLWGAVSHLANHENYVIEFIPAGTSLQADKVVGYRVIQMDTGKGEMDQHGKDFKRTSSFELFCQKYGLDQDPAMRPLIEMTIASDNVEEIKRTDIAYVLKGLAHYYKDEDTEGKNIDWGAAQVFAFAALDILYGQAKQREHNRKVYEANKDVRTLTNGYKVANLWFRPGTRDAAFEDGNDVAVYFVKRGEKFYPIIQVNRNSPVILDRVIFGLRSAEAKKREVSTRGIDLWAIGSNPAFGAWFFHDSRKMIACGTLGHELQNPQEFTKLSPSAIMNIVCEKIGDLNPKK